MRRIGFACLLAVACASPVAIAATPAPPRAELSQFICRRALDPPNRLVSIEAVMRPMKATKQMQLRFDLLSKTSDPGTFTPLTGGDLGMWRSPPNPTLGQQPNDVWLLKHPVSDLAAPAAYRFQVSFRWFGAHGRLLGSAARSSRVCFEPELRPDLLVQSIVVSPVSGHPKVDEYVTTIANNGATGAGPFEVEFTDGSVVRTPTVRHISPHATKVINFFGPVCDPTAPPTVTVDPTDQVDDLNRSNNSLTATCPGA
jgi:hypothetical protein